MSPSWQQSGHRDRGRDVYPGTREYTCGNPELPELEPRILRPFVEDFGNKELK